MLVHLSVEDLGLIEKIEFDPGSGLHVLSGETGVGKSMLLASMLILRGERTRTDVIRRGASRAFVRGIFQLSESNCQKISEELGFSIEDGELLIEREIAKEGRSRCRIDGRESTTTVLRRIAPFLIEVIGQGQALTLLQSETQLELLDRFGGLLEKRQAHASAWNEARELEKRIQALEESSRERRDRALFLEHVIEELEQASLKKGQRASLEQELELLEERDRVLAAIAGARTRILDKDGCVLDSLGSTERDLRGFEQLHPGIAALLEGCIQSRSLLEDSLRELSGIDADLDMDPVALDQKSRRLDQIVTLEEKYHRPEEDLLSYLAECRNEQQQISGDSEELPDLHAGLSRCVDQLKEGTRLLTEARVKIIQQLTRYCSDELKDLGLEKAKIVGELSPLEGTRYWNGMDEKGADQFRICFSANPGEHVRPLAEVASGGELSRVMLALVKTLAGVTGTETLVFDEIDSNVGGRMGFAIGQKLRQIGESHQVLCVTHLPQVACHGMWQHKVVKQVDGGKTSTFLESLEGEDRIRELASMLRGDRATERSLEEARAMVVEANTLETA